VPPEADKSETEAAVHPEADKSESEAAVHPEADKLQTEAAVEANLLDATIGTWATPGSMIDTPVLPEAEHPSLPQDRAS